MTLLIKLKGKISVEAVVKHHKKITIVYLLVINHSAVS